MLYRLSYMGLTCWLRLCRLWAVKDSNLRSLLTTDLQSVPFGHLGNRPHIDLVVCSSTSRFVPLEKATRDEPTNRPTFGADDENRTRNRPLTRRVLCRLSYVGKRAERLYQTQKSPVKVIAALTGSRQSLAGLVRLVNGKTLTSSL